MNSGSPLFQSGFKWQRPGSIMQDRIGFADDAMRKEFFAAAREAREAKNWGILWQTLNLPRTSFQSYQYGSQLLPKSVFDSMLRFLTQEKQQFFLSQTFIKPRNWGAVKGGIQNSEKNRDKLLEQLARARCKGNGVPKIVDISQPLSKELCELVGAVIGDGCIDGHVRKNGKCSYHMSITGDAERDKDYLTSKMPSIIGQLFNIPTHI
ncbi:MAG: hypothetical protein NTW59_04070, partial [Candidatus Diapherotrites archaeon]|nr:hypothetical protein [Candidatus Diapherotrites archaeon]